MTMRELTLLETGYLGGLLLLSLVLPLWLSVHGSRDVANRKLCLRTVWAGQALLTLAGLAVLVSVTLAPYAVVFGVMGCGGGGLLRRRQLRVARLVGPTRPV